MTREPWTADGLAVEHEPRPGQGPCAVKVTRGAMTTIERLSISDAAALAEMLQDYVTMYGGRKID
jgi:hypothetical protein